jgi:HK97 family phage major capsid protein
LQTLEQATIDAATGWIMAPRTKFTLAGLTATDGQPLNAPSVVAEIPTLSTSKIPIDQDQGTSSDASTIFVGDFRQLMVGVRSELRVDVLTERYADTMEIGFIAHTRLDVQIAQPAHFAEIVGIIP